jgi:hypothetical protein
MKELNKNKLKQISYNCKQATFLIEKKQIGKITLREHFALKFHLAGCSVCRIFLKQSLTINRMVKSLFHGNDPSDLTLDDHFKQNLQERIDQYLDRK